MAVRIWPAHLTEWNSKPAASETAMTRKPDFERGEIAAALREFPGLPGGERVNEAEQRGEREIALVAKAKFVAHQKVEVIEIKNRREGIHPFDRETGRI